MSRAAQASAKRLAARVRARRIKVIYPWISKPDEEGPLSPEEQKRREKEEKKANRVKYSKAR